MLVQVPTFHLWGRVNTPKHLTVYKKEINMGNKKIITCKIIDVLIDYNEDHQSHQANLWVVVRVNVHLSHLK